MDRSAPHPCPRPQRPFFLIKEGKEQVSKPTSVLLPVRNEADKMCVSRPVLCGSTTSTAGTTGESSKKRKMTDRCVEDGRWGERGEERRREVEEERGKGCYVFTLSPGNPPDIITTISLRLTDLCLHSNTHIHTYTNTHSHT